MDNGPVVHKLVRRGSGPIGCRAIVDVMRINEYIGRIDAVGEQDEREAFGWMEAGAVAQAVLEGRFLTTCPATVEELEEIVDRAEQARAWVWRCSLGLVLAQARQASEAHRCPFEDLLQAGCVGLGEAMMRFDPERGTRFSTVAWTWVRRRIGEEIARQRGGRPLSRRRAEAAVRRAEEELTARLGRRPSDAEIGLAMGRGRDWVRARRSIGEDVGGDVVAGLALPVEEDHDGGLVAELIDVLHGEERVVIMLRNGFSGPPMTLAEIAARRGVSEASVRRVEARALARLRRYVARQAA